MSETSSSSTSEDRISPNTNTNDPVTSTPTLPSGLPSTSMTPSLNPQPDPAMDNAVDATTLSSSSLPSTFSSTLTTSTSIPTSLPSSLSNSKITAYIHPKLLSKRPTKPFLIFMKDKRDFYRAKMESDPTMSTNINAVLGEAWQNLGPTDRAFYQQQYTDETNAFNTRLTDLGVPSSARVVLEPPPNGQDIWLASEDDIKAISKERSSSLSSTSTFSSTTSGTSTGSILGSNTSSRPVTKRGRAGIGAISMERAIRLRDHGEASLPHEIPVQKVRSLVTAIPGISVISTETASLIARAGEEFLLYFAERMLTSATEKRRRTLVYDDVRRAIRAEKSLQFLRVPFFAEAGPDAPDVVPNFDMTSAELALADRNANSGLFNGTSSSVPTSIGTLSSKKASSKNHLGSAGKKETRDVPSSEAGVSREMSEIGDQSSVEMAGEEGEKEILTTSTVVAGAPTPKPRSRAPRSKPTTTADKSKSSSIGAGDIGLDSTLEGPKLSSKTKSPARPRGKNATNAHSDTVPIRFPVESTGNGIGDAISSISSMVTDSESTISGSGSVLTKKVPASRKREPRSSKKNSEQTTDKETTNKGRKEDETATMASTPLDSSSHLLPMVDALQQHVPYSTDISKLSTFPLVSIPTTTSSLAPMTSSDIISQDSHALAYAIGSKRDSYVLANESGESIMPLHMQMQLQQIQPQMQMQMRPDQLPASAAGYTNFTMPLHHTVQGSPPIYTDISAGMTSSSLPPGQPQYQYNSSANISYHYPQNDIAVSHFQAQILSPSHETVTGQSGGPILNSPFLYTDSSTLVSTLPDSLSNASHGNTVSASGMYSGSFQSLEAQQHQQHQQQYATYDGSHVYQAQRQAQDQEQEQDVERNQHFSEVQSQYPIHDHGHVQALPQQYNGTEGALYNSSSAVDIYGNVAAHQEYQQQQYQTHYVSSDTPHYDYQQQQQQAQQQQQQQQQ